MFTKDSFDESQELEQRLLSGNLQYIIIINLFNVNLL